MWNVLLKDGMHEEMVFKVHFYSYTTCLTSIVWFYKIRENLVIAQFAMHWFIKRKRCAFIMSVALKILNGAHLIINFKWCRASDSLVFENEEIWSSKGWWYLDRVHQFWRKDCLQAGKELHPVRFSSFNPRVPW